MKPRYWMVCDCTDRNQTPCLFDEETALKRPGAFPRCIRHGALLFSDSTLNDLDRVAATKKLKGEK